MAKRGRGQKVYFVIYCDIPGNSIDKDIRYGCIGQMGARKYPRESFYHHIECFAANSLTALMRK